MKNLIDNKIIAVIGNAQHLFDESFGKEIDSHETVIRINRSASICFTEKYRSLKKTHGFKTTIWAFSFADTMRNAIQKNYTKATFLIQMNDISKNKIKHPFKFDAITRDEITELKQKLNKYHEEEYKNYGPSTGLRVLDYISKFSPLEVNIYGFDWKKTPTFYDFKHETRNVEVKHNHNYLVEMEYCKKVFKNKYGYTFKGVEL